MDKGKQITWGIVAITVLIVALVLTNTLHQYEHIVLPDTEPMREQATDGASGNGDGLQVIEITPETVRAAIATLNRPESYQRTVTIEQLWNGGSGSYEVTATAVGPWTQTDRVMPDGRIRHSVVGKETAYVWYNHERSIYTGSAGAITADNEQSIPTYEDILELEQITLADYRMLSDEHCIYVEAVVGEYTLCYWVSTDSGLLAAAEKQLNGQTVYRMEASVPQPGPTQLTLPDGTLLTAE